MEEIRNTETVVTEKAQEQKKEQAPKKTFKDFMAGIEAKLTRKSVGTLILQIFILFFAIPEAFLMLCGLIFDKWLKLYNLTPVIFVVWVIILIIGIILSVMSIIWYNRNKKSN